MHRFWDSVYAHLHQLVLDALASDHAALLVPLLGLSRHFRALAARYLVKEYSGTRFVRWDPVDEVHDRPVIEGGEWIKPAAAIARQIVVSSRSPYDSFESDDPRARLGEENEEDAADHFVPLVLEAFDPVTLVCTFKPAMKTRLHTDIICDDSPERVAAPDIIRGIDAIPTGWYRATRSSDKKKTIMHGLVLAYAPEYFAEPATVGAFDFPPGKDVSKKIVGEQLHWVNWRVSYDISRDDSAYEVMHEMEELLGRADEFGDLGMTFVPAFCSFDKAEIPLIDLFKPPQLSEKARWDFSP
ncbi:hypothetical protein Rhopal_001286-T1 [Rhodotorula paludigena]|uniref:Uncharacterized protein n=1 Tax=Rhodotorula paludigena TaxID=86838 RepID=A0AAV5G6Z1_9BASI|nr:hypothetical protein Rhopal_001286-T1 [Rhodotorula paludigena]